MRALERTRRGLVVHAALIALLAPPAFADLPALSRPLRTENETITSASLAARRSFEFGARLGWLRATRDRRVGRRLERHLLVAGAAASREWGRWSLNAEGFYDGESRLEADELSAGGGAALYRPEQRTELRAEIGAGPAGRLAGQVESETRLLRLKLLRTSAELWPLLYAWNRARWMEDEAGPHWIPAVGLVTSHLPIVASTVDVGLSARSDWHRGDLPRTELLVHLGLNGAEHPLGGGTGLDLLPGGRHADRDEDRSAAWRAFLGWAIPLDERSSGRLTLQVGGRFLDP